MSKERTISTKKEAKMFALFLACERNRHIEDIRRADRDLYTLKHKWGISIPWNANYFTVVDKL